MLILTKLIEKTLEKPRPEYYVLASKNIVLESQNVIFLESGGTLTTFQTISEHDNKKCGKHKNSE